MPISESLKNNFNDLRHSVENEISDKEIMKWSTSVLNQLQKFLSEAGEQKGIKPNYKFIMCQFCNSSPAVCKVCGHTIELPIII